MIYYKVLANELWKPEKYYNLPSTNWRRPKKAVGVVQRAERAGELMV